LEKKPLSQSLEKAVQSTSNWQHKSADKPSAKITNTISKKK